MLWKRRSITENTLTFVKEDLEACGLELERLSDLPTEVRSMIGIPMRAPGVESRRPPRHSNGTPAPWLARLPGGRSTRRADASPFPGRLMVGQRPLEP